MDIEKLIKDLHGLLKQYGEKIPYGELVGAPWPYSRAGDLVWQDLEPYLIEQAANALSTLQAENEKLRAELEQVKKERRCGIPLQKWIHLGGDEWCCRSCGNVIYTEGSWEKPRKKYCEECGAKMDVKQEE